MTDDSNQTAPASSPADASNQAEDSGLSTPTNPTNAKQGSGKGKKHHQKQHPRSYPSSTKQGSVFKGSLADMNGHVFEVHNEGNKSTQWVRSVEEVELYCGRTLPYATDITYAITHLEEFDLDAVKPADPATGAGATDTRIWEKEVDDYVKRRNAYVQNHGKASAIIWGQCSDGMKARLAASPFYIAYEKKKNCVSLLKEIKAISYKFESQKYPYAAIYDANAAFYRMSQGRHQTISDFVTKHKNTTNIIDHYGGALGTDPVLVKDIAFRNNIIPTPDADFPLKHDKYKMCETLASERYLAYALLRAADKTRYSSVIRDLENQYSLDNDQFPSTVTDSFGVLINYKKHYQGNSTEHKDDDFAFTNSHEKPKGKGVTCFSCGGDHYANDPKCPNFKLRNKTNDKLDNYSKSLSTSTKSSSKLTTTISSHEPPASSPGPSILTTSTSKPATYSQAVSFLLNAAETEPSGSSLDFDNDDFCFVTATASPLQNLVMTQGPLINQNWILLDNQSTVHLFSNPSLVHTVFTVPEEESLLVHGTGGSQRTQQTATFDLFGTVWFNPSALANILSFSVLIRAGYHIDFCCRSNSFSIHLPDRPPMIFRCSSHGLYYFDASQSPFAATFVNTVASNKALFSPRQIASADAARDLYIQLGRPAEQVFKHMLLHKLIKNTTVTVPDVTRAVTIYGPDLGSLQGKVVRRTPPHVRLPTRLSLPPDVMAQHRSVTLCSDIFYVDGQQFLLSTSRNLQFCTVELIRTHTSDLIFAGLGRILNLYKFRDFSVDWILADGQFSPLANRVLTLHATLNTTAAGEHVPEVERLIRVIKERLRAFRAVAPFAHMPRLLKSELILLIVQMLNFTVHPNSISPFLSPSEIVLGTSLDASIHCRVTPCSFCHIHEEPDPTNSTSIPRTLDAIALRPVGNAQGSYFFLCLSTWSRVKRRKWTVLPMPTSVITLIEQKALSERTTLPKHVREQVSDFVFRRVDHSIITSFDDDDSHLLPNPELDEGALVPHHLSAPVNQDTNSLQDDSANQDDISVQHDLDDTASLDSAQGAVSIDEGADSINEGADSIDEGADSTDEGANDDHVSIQYDQTANDVSIPVRADMLDTFANDLPEVIQRDARAKDDINSEVTSANIVPTQQEDNRPASTRYSMRPRVPPVQPSDFNSKDGFVNACVRSQFKVTSPSDYSSRHGLALDVILTQMSAREGLKRFGKDAADALIKEWKQLDDLNVFDGKHFHDLSSEDKKKALRLVQLIKEKRCGMIKGRTCADGRSQRKYIPEEEASSPTVTTEALLLALIIDAKEGRDVATADVPGAFLQVDIDDDVYVVVDGALVDLLIQSNPKYAAFVHMTKDGRKLVYLKLNKALYGTLTAARLFFDDLSGRFASIGFEANPYDPCIMNKIIDGTQCTIAVHVDDLKVSHKKPEVVTDILEFLSKAYKTELTITRGNKHTYVGMDLEFPGDGTIKVNQKPHLKDALDSFPDLLDKIVTSPAAEHIFTVNEECEKLPEAQRELLHKIVAKLLFVSTRGRPDIYLPISFLTSRVTKADTDDWKKLTRLLNYVKATMELELTLSADNANIVKWWVDAAYAVRDDYKSQTGSTMSLGHGVLMSKSTKQKLNTKSSTEAELVGVSDTLSQILWTNYFLEHQHYDTDDTILFQDNTSAIQMENNGKMSTGKRSKHIHIRYFFIKDRVHNNEVSIRHCPTDMMLADFWTKPLQGKLFLKFRDQILGITCIEYPDVV